MKKRNQRYSLERKESPNIEHITVGFELKQIEDDDDDFFVFEGFASTFGNVDLVDDVVLPGAFTESIRKTMPVILWQHNRSEPIGMPVEISENASGLFVKARLPKADEFVSGRVIPQIEVGSIKAMSIGFRTIESEFREDGVRLLQKVDLKEVSLVTFPANESALVTDFKMNVDDVSKITTRREFEKTLRESGVFSKEAACALASKFIDQGEPDNEEEAMDLLGDLSKKMEDAQVSATLNNIMRKMEK